MPFGHAVFLSKSTEEIEEIGKSCRIFAAGVESWQERGDSDAT